MKKTAIETKPSVTVEVNVTKIVKYACIASVLIIGIIFGTTCYQKVLKQCHESK